MVSKIRWSAKLSLSIIKLLELEAGEITMNIYLISITELISGWQTIGDGALFITIN